jgi:hypothetical protein
MTRERRLKAILDPYIFWLPAIPTERSIKDLLASMDFVISAVRSGVTVSVTKAVWQRINQEFIRFAATKMPSHNLATRVKILTQTLTFTEAPPVQGETWGIKSQYTFADLPDPAFWLSELAKIAVHWSTEEEEFIFLTRLLIGRNVREHQTANCVIWEKTHWQIFVKSRTENAVSVAIPCVTSLRNLSVTWTQRYDDRLPDTAPTSGLAFVPVPDWRKASVSVIRTIQSKPTWEDLAGNGWSDTNTPGTAHHWDVFLHTASMVKKFGGVHVNIKSWGSDDRGRVPGDVHH